jgi:hypothetical protein
MLRPRAGAHSVAQGCSDSSLIRRGTRAARRPVRCREATVEMSREDQKSRSGAEIGVVSSRENRRICVREE